MLTWIKLWIDVAIVMSGGGHKLREVKPCSARVVHVQAGCQVVRSGSVTVTLGSFVEPSKIVATQEMIDDPLYGMLWRIVGHFRLDRLSDNGYNVRQMAKLGKRRTIRLTEELDKRITEMSDKLDVKVSDIVRDLLEYAFKQLSDNS